MGRLGQTQTSRVASMLLAFLRATASFVATSTSTTILQSMLSSLFTELLWELRLFHSAFSKARLLVLFAKLSQRCWETWLTTVSSRIFCFRQIITARLRRPL